jgi:predicted P-loop ATPase
MQNIKDTTMSKVTNVEINKAYVGKAASMDHPLDVSQFPHPKFKVDKDGKRTINGLMNTMQNLEHLLELYGVQLAYNEMTRLREITLPQANFSRDNLDDRAMNAIDNLAILNGMSLTTERLSGYLSCIAEKNCYHPVRVWIFSQPWDGVSRLQHLADTLAVKRHFEAHRDAMLKRWLLSAVAALFSENPNDKFELALTLQGFQGKGKTSWFKRLVLPSLRAVKEGMQLDPHNKDSVFILAGHWIAELGELDATFSKSQVGRIKSFMSNSYDMLRRPYAHFDSRMKRQTVIGASVNKPDFLIDETGNRRWLTIPIIGVDYTHSIDMQQLWAEVKSMYDSGEQWWLTATEYDYLTKVNQDFEVVLPIYEMLVDAFNFIEAEDALSGTKPDMRKCIRITATQAITLFGLPKDRKTVTEAGAALRRLTGTDSVSCGGARVWRVSPNSTSTYRDQVKTLFGDAS